MATAVVLTVECTLTQPGEAVFVVGNHELLGNWNPELAQMMSTSDATYPRWATAELVVVDGKDLQYKFIIQREDRTGEVRWEDMEGNRVLEVVAGAGMVKADSVWNDARSSTLTCPSPKMSPHGSASTSPRRGAEAPAQFPGNMSPPNMAQSNSIDERGSAITPPVYQAPPGTVARIQALTKELTATDKLLVDRNQYCRSIELSMGQAKKKVSEQAIELAAKEARLAQAAAALELAERRSAEKDVKVEELHRKVSDLERELRFSQSDAVVALEEKLNIPPMPASSDAVMAQVQRHEATINMLQRQLAERDAEVKKLQRKLSKSATNPQDIITAQKDIISAQKKLNEAARSAHANHLAWKNCHSLRAR